MPETVIDINFDFRTDANRGDPDKTSPTLKKYHQLLWSKPLPSGKPFQLESNSRKGYLYHNSDLGEFVLTSDSVLPTFARHKRYSHIIDQLPAEEIEAFDHITYTIGGMMIFPGNRIDGQMTINGARGCNQKIRDRFDLTVECIRRFYEEVESPLYSVLARYEYFFRLFTDFKSYIDFFLLNDLVENDYSTVRFFTPFISFDESPVPSDLESYKQLRERTVAFVKARNTRIASSAEARSVLE
jgi:hypothetical protein